MEYGMLKALNSDCIDVDLSQCQNNELTLGRNPLTGVKVKRCSKNQVSVHLDSNGDVFLCRNGPNISKLNDKVLEKDQRTLMQNDDILYLLEDDFAFKLSKPVTPSPKKSNKLMNDEKKNSKLKQSSVSSFFTSPKKRKAEEMNVSKSDVVESATSSDEEQQAINEQKLKRLRQNDTSDKEKNGDSNIVSSSASIPAPESRWEQHENFMLFNSEGLKASSKIAAFDIDGTIITTKSGRVFPVDMHDWRIFLPEIPGKLKKLITDGYKIVFFTNQKSIGKGESCPEEFKNKVEFILKKLGVPAQVFVCTHSGYYRKPLPGVWIYLNEKANNGVVIDDESSFYVGDAAGRPVKFLPGRKKDFACSDRLFALNIGLKFYTPEEYFQGHKPALFSLPAFDPRNLPSCNLYEPSTSKLLSDSLEVVILVGMPASGKSHFTQDHLVKNGYAHVNRDTLGSWQKCVSKCKDYLLNGKSVVVDNTNPDKESRKRFVDCAKSVNVKCRCFVFDVSVEWARHNNKFRQITDVDKTHAHVSDVILYTFRKNYKPPKKDEGFEEILTINFVPSFQSEKDEKLYKMFLVEK